MQPGQYFFLTFALLTCLFFHTLSAQEVESTKKLDIEGKILAPTPDSTWFKNTQVYIRGGMYIGFPREDGIFTIKNVPAGSYILEVVSPDYMFDPVRIEINNKGKIRARTINYIQTSELILVPYPLKLKSVGKIKYFQTREQWRVTDLLFNPMVLMMVAPLLLIMVIPRLMNDPETRREMEQLQSMTKLEVPEMSEVLTSYFGGEQPKKPKVTPRTKAKKSD